MVNAMACSFCGSIPAVASANTGREEYFGPPISSLKKLGIESYDDLWECPECDAVFLWHDYTAQTGSGNNDEETLNRLPSEQSSIIRTFLHRGERSAADTARDAGRLSELPEHVRELVLSHLLRHDRDLAAILVPPKRECSICRSIASYPPTKLRRDGPLPAPLSSLVPLGASADLDLWECPECNSMFKWESAKGVDGQLSRQVEPLASALRACVHRNGVVPDSAVKTVFDCDAARVVILHGIVRDRELVRQLVPRMIAGLVTWEREWLRDLLCAFVIGDRNDAKTVLDTIEKSPRTNQSLETVAARCRW